LSDACAAHARLGPASLVLYDVSTLYFEADQGDGFREPGFSKERRLELQITIGLLTGQDGFPLMISAFEGNRAETKTMLPVIEKFMAAHQLPDVTVVAGAGMISEASQKAIEAAGLSFILGMKIPGVPYQVAQWRREHPGKDIPDGHVFTQPWPAGPSSKRRDQMIYYQFRAGRGRRTLRGIEQVAKAAKAVAGLAPVKRNRFVQLDGAVKSVNRELEARARDLAGSKGYVTNLAACPNGTPVTAGFVIGSRSSSPPSPSPGSSRTAPAGPSRNSSAQHTDTAPSRSAPASTSSPPKTRSRPTSATPSQSSSNPAGAH
jgi:hypothetical protein